MNKNDEGPLLDSAAASGELLHVHEKIAQARAELARLEHDIDDAVAPMAEQVQIDQLIEANQQLVLAMLASSSQTRQPGKDALAAQYRDTRHANEQLVISALRAQNLQAKAERGFAHQKTALTTVAHELRNPLTPISMIAGQMVRVPREELPRLQVMIQDQVKHMARLIEDLLDVSRANTGKMRLGRADIDFVEILKAACAACQAMMTNKGLQLSSHIPGQPLIVHGDAVRLAQVLHNLLTNAAKYTPSGGTVAVAVEVAAETVTVSVRDSGIGISSKFLLRAFEPYAQDLRAVALDSSGLGIGLTVVRELVIAHGGTVVCRSEGEGQGSEFSVTLPLVVPEHTV